MASLYHAASLKCTWAQNTGFLVQSWVRDPGPLLTALSPVCGGPAGVQWALSRSGSLTPGEDSPFRSGLAKDMGSQPSQRPVRRGKPLRPFSVRPEFAAKPTLRRAQTQPPHRSLCGFQQFPHISVLQAPPLPDGGTGTSQGVAVGAWGGGACGPWTPAPHCRAGSCSGDDLGELPCICWDPHAASAGGSSSCPQGCGPATLPRMDWVAWALCPKAPGWGSRTGLADDAPLSWSTGPRPPCAFLELAR